MIAIDTNVLVRFLTNDDPVQADAARQLIDSNEVLIPDTVILETEWVLRYSYRSSSRDIEGAFYRLFSVSNIVLENPVQMADCLELYHDGMDFADALHVVKSESADAFYTFDERLIKKAKAKDFKVLRPN